jgi:TRAP-type mannitol/chloroaromatic compound transport system substrate-binding protein
VNQAAFAALPADLQAIVEIACSAVNDQMEAEFTARNASALAKLRDDAGVEIRPFPDEVLIELRTLTDRVIEKMVADDPVVARVMESVTAYRAQVNDWTAISEHAMLNVRNL